MNKLRYIIVPSILILLSCSKENPIPDTMVKAIKLFKVTPQRAKIGDTIIIEGENLDKIWLKFNDVLYINTISVSSNKITAIVPTLDNENVKIYAMVYKRPGVATDSILFNLVGFFSLNSPFQGDDIYHVKAINEKIYFTSTYSRLYKTVDGAYNWSLIKDFNSWINSIFFLDENTGWVSVSDNFVNNLYFTNDGGISFQLLITSAPGMSGRQIMDMLFSSANQGYIITGKGEIYATHDNIEFNLIYEFPENNKENGWTEFNYLTVFNNKIMTVGLSGKNGDLPVLIIGEDNNFNYLTFDELLQKVQLINDNEAYLIKGDKLYFTANGGNAWEKVSDMKLHNIYFSDKSTGFGTSFVENYAHEIILQTGNGGINWQKGIELMDFEYTLDMTFIGKVGLICGPRSKLWKYIKE
jgi:photosystem II stability/assembly factor-like uncharacterized protein